MNTELYEVIARGMRYWFLLLGVLMVLRSFWWLHSDRRARHRRLKQLPDAGMIGELLVIRGSDELPEGSLIPLPYEGTLGFVRSSDVVVPCNQVAAQHLDFSFQSQLGLLVYPRRGTDCLVDGERIVSRRQARQWPLLHNSILTVGEAQLQVRLFAGLDVQRHAQRSEGMVTHPTADGREHAHEQVSAPTKPQKRLFGQVVRHPEDSYVTPTEPTLFGQPLSHQAGSRHHGRRRSHGAKEESLQDED